MIFVLILYLNNSYCHAHLVMERAPIKGHKFSSQVDVSIHLRCNRSGYFFRQIAQADSSETNPDRKRVMGVLGFTEQFIFTDTQFFGITKKFDILLMVTEGHPSQFGY